MNRPRRPYALAAVALALVAVAAVVFAARTDPSRLGAAKVDPQRLPDGPSAPDLGGGAGWINSRPLRSGDLSGKVVVYDVWTYSCVNCVRTLPYLRAWYDRYRSDGLEIVGVHTPEFRFEWSRANVEAATRRLDVNWPVVLDNDQKIWDRLGNRFWPSKYVADRQGQIRFRHIGEGRYQETEDVLRSLLGVDPASPRAAAPDEASRPVTVVITRETYLGTQRGNTGARPGRATYPEPGPLASGEARLVGDWVANEESVAAASPGAAIVLAYKAAEVNLVLTVPRGDDPVEVVVERDGRPLPPEARTPDTVLDESGTTFIRVDHDGLFRLVAGTVEVGEHVLRLTARAPGVSAFAFTFGD
jgi:thiol-disulfide isomerase/thioredoxin